MKQKLIYLIAFSVVSIFEAQVFNQAEARVGRPLTPVSVAGVARRTVRRCAVGVYYCRVDKLVNLKEKTT